MKRKALYVIFYKNPITHSWRKGPVYAGKFKDFNGIGSYYFGTSGVQKRMNYEIARILKIKMPENISETQFAVYEAILIAYVATKYGLADIVKHFAVVDDWWNSFKHGGRCINCHNTIGPSMKKVRAIGRGLEDLKIYGVPTEEVTPEMRKENKKQNHKRWKDENKEHLTKLRLLRKDKDNAKARVRWKRNKDKNNARKKNYYYRTLDKQKERKAVYYINNKAKVQERGKKWRENNKKHIAEKNHLQHLAAIATFSFGSYTAVDGKRHKISQKEIDNKALRREPVLESIKHLFKPELFSCA